MPYEDDVIFIEEHGSYRVASIMLANGTCPVQEFLSQNRKVLVRVLPTIQQLNKTGWCNNKERFKKLKGHENLYQIKNDQLRDRATVLL